MGNFFRDLDDRIVQQSYGRAENERAKAIENIKQGMMRDQSNKSYGETYEGMAPQYPASMRENAETSDAYYDVAAARYMDSVGAGPMESLNVAMAENPYARYGVAGTAAVGGGMAMTAGAQKLLGLMGLLSEAGETEVARDMPLQS